MKKKDKQNILDEIDEFFNKHNISGIIRIPNYGTFSNFKSEGDKLSILEYAKIELELLEQLRKNEVNFRLCEENDILSKKNKKHPKYIQ
ncbi:hypothetical protein KAI04_04875 [Candidatus Pacearchaeota archaeon]|nr:hypothetical protein [Candidatus Pacearchaeota archaeon]